MEDNKKLSINKNIIILIGIIAVLIVGVIVFLLNRSPGIEIVGEFADDNHIKALGRFTVTGANDLTTEELSARLSFQPEREFALASTKDAGVYQLKTFLPLDAGKPVTISLNKSTGGQEKQWKFQTEDSFKVIETFPAQGAENVPPSSSVEIKLSYADIDPDTINEFVSVSDNLECFYTLINNTIVVSPSYADYFPAMSNVEITVSGNLARENGSTLGEDYTLKFTTGAEENPDNRLSSMNERVTENILPGDPILLKLDIGANLQDTDLVTTLYKYKSAEEYYDALASYQNTLIEKQYVDTGNRGLHDNWQVDTTNLQIIEEVTGKAITVHDDFTRYILLDNNLEEGWYAATVEGTMPSGGKITASKLIQVNPLSIYYSHVNSFTKDNENHLIIWINSSETGKPINNAKFSITATNYMAEGSTDSKGIANITASTTPIDRSGDQKDNINYSEPVGILKVEDNDNVFYDIYGGGWGSTLYKDDPSVKYLSYIFTDRPVYRHTDTIKFWGTVLPRVQGTPMPESLQLVMADDTIKVPVTVDDNGTFIGEYDLKRASADGLWIDLRDENNHSYADIFIELEDYTKPEYQTSATVKQPVYTAWQDYGNGIGNVEIDFTAQYFEGTPAQNYTAVVRVPEESYSDTGFDEVELSTNELGNAKAVIHPNEPEYEEAQEQWQALQVYYGIFSTQELAQPQLQGGSFMFFNRDRMVRIKNSDKAGDVELAVNQIDTSKVQTEDDARDEDKITGDPVANLNVDIEVYHTWFEKIPDGERYDMISKKNVTAYRTEWQEELSDSFSVTTNNQGEFLLTGLPTSQEPGESYHIKAITLDNRGNRVAETFYYSQNNNDYTYKDSYQLFAREEDSSEGLHLGTYGQLFDDGENLELYLAKNREEIQDFSGELFYFVSQDDIVDYNVVNSDSFQLPFKEEYIPNYAVSGAYFDGRYIYPIYTSKYIFNPEKRDLDIKVDYDKKSYKPKETANLSFTVTEKDTNKPAANATLLTAVVDEAVFAVQEQTPSFLQSLYKSKYFPNIYQYTSYDNDMKFGDGYGGGGPYAFSPRIDFPDTLTFSQLTTDQQGKANISVTLPDNLTSWRTTMLSLSPDRKAGDAKDNFIVSKDFFVSPVLPPRLIVGDDLIITVHSDGKKINPDDMVDYTCTIEGRSGSYTASGKAGDFTPIPLEENLPIGNYQLTVVGEWQDSKDGVTLPLSVVENGINVPVSAQISLKDAATLESTAWPVSYGFYDKSQELNIEILSKLLSYTGERIDEKIPRKFALNRMVEAGLDTTYIDTSILTEDFTEYLTEEYYYKLFPSSAEDIILTARIFQANQFNYGDLAIDTNNLPDDPSQRAAALLCSERNNIKTKEEIISALGSTGYSVSDRFFLATALAKNGKTAMAVEEYTKLTKDLTEQVDANGHTMLSLNGNLQDTAAALMTALELKQPQAEGFAWFLLNTPPTDNLYLLELMSYVNTQPMPENNTTITYTLNGEEETLNLNEGAIYQSFSEDQLANASFKGSGQVWVNAFYTADLDKAMDRANETLKINKSIQPVGEEPLKQGDLAKITIVFEIPDSVQIDKEAQLQIDDYLPTGMRYESMAGETGWELTSRNDQRLSFTAKRDKAQELVFYARCVAPGNYVVESSFARITNGNLWGVSPRESIEILPKDILKQTPSESLDS